MSIVENYARLQVHQRLTERGSTSMGKTTVVSRERLARQLAPRTLDIKTDTSEVMLTIPHTYIIKSRINSFLRRWS
ncbi:MAG: hypothetical protein ACTSUO_00675 [Candidatus Thorarchaeota archaeon]